jgi:Protein of unknown function (DUF1236)
VKSAALKGRAQPNRKVNRMTERKLGIAIVAALLATPLAAQAQGGGAEKGAAQGNAAAGPVGDVAGSTGLIGADQASRFRDYALREHRSAIPFNQRLQPGVRLPLAGVTYYPVPPEYGVSPRYRYTIVNGYAVIVDPTTRRVVQVID